MKQSTNIFLQLGVLLLFLSLGSVGTDAKVLYATYKAGVQHDYNSHVLNQLNENYVHAGQRIKTKPIARRIKASRERSLFVITQYIFTQDHIFPADNYQCSFYLFITPETSVIQISERAPPFYMI
ncbi:MAG: hypothetical protein P4L41_03940 [Flavipsychrobacter sp.]|nr:hypothetical protein [Flavipsychrobacter sp.]